MLYYISLLSNQYFKRTIKMRNQTEPPHLMNQLTNPKPPPLIRIKFLNSIIYPSLFSQSVRLFSSLILYKECIAYSFSKSFFKYAFLDLSISRPT